MKGTLGATLIARCGRGLLSRRGRTATPGGAAGAGGTTLGRRGDSGIRTRDCEAPCTRRAMAPRLAAEEPGHGAEWQKVPWRGGEGKAAAAGEGRAADLEYGTIDVHERGSEGAEEEKREEEAAPGVAEPRQAGGRSNWGGSCGCDLQRQDTRLGAARERGRRRESRGGGRPRRRYGRRGERGSGRARGGAKGGGREDVLVPPRLDRSRNMSRGQLAIGGATMGRNRGERRGGESEGTSGQRCMARSRARSGSRRDRESRWRKQVLQPPRLRSRGTLRCDPLEGSRTTGR